MAWLDQHPPSRSQFRDPRRQTPSGLIVVHTAENVMDTVGPDTGAEGVANFIRTRDTPGSYHDLVDSDSTIHLIRYTCEAFHDGTGSNPHSYGLSFACRTTSWKTMGAPKREGFLQRGANAAAIYARWVQQDYGVSIPAQRVTRVESDNRRPGFISHGQRDPGRRTDPGEDFPWSDFLALFKSLTTDPVPPPTPRPKDDDMAYAVKGDTSPKVYATNWIHKWHIPNNDTLVDMAFNGLQTNEGHPYVVAQATIDAVRDAP